MRKILLTTAVLAVSMTSAFAATGTSLIPFLDDGQSVSSYDIEKFQDNGEEGSYANGYVISFTGNSLGTGGEIENYIVVTCGGKTKTDTPSLMINAEADGNVLYMDTIDIDEARLNPKRQGFVNFWEAVCK